MLNALHIAATGMAAQQLNVETISHNLANMGTTGFKRSRVSFSEMVNQGSRPRSAGDSMLAPLRGLTSDRSMGAGVNVASVKTIFELGEPRKTDQPQDVMISGDGFLEVVMPDGTRAFSRGGNLKTDADGLLTTQEGHALKPHLVIPDGVQSMTIAADGRVSVRSAAQRPWVEVGQLPLARFNNASGLEPIGGQLYRSTQASGESISGQAEEAGFGSIRQGYVESGNVKLVDEYVGLMLAQRAYEASAKVVQASDEMLAMVNNLRK